MTVSTVRSEEKTASARHPLAPLTVAEAGTAARVALDASGPGSRLVYCALAEPAKAAVRGWERRPAGAAGGAVRGLRAPEAADLAGDRGAGRAGRVTSAVPVPGVQPLGHRRTVRRRQRADQAGAGVPGGARPAGPDRHVGHRGGRLAGRLLRPRRRQVGAAAGPRRRLRARRAEPEPVRAADREPGRDLGPGRRRDRRARRTATRCRCPPTPAGTTRPAPRRTASWPSCGSCSRTVPGSPSTTGSCAGAHGSCGSRCTRSRAWCCTRSPTSTGSGRGRSCSGRRCRRWSCPTGRRR